MRIEQRKFHADVGGVVVVVGVPLLGGYLIPVDGQDPAFGASATRIKIIRALNLGSMKVYLPMGTNVPSMTDPFRLKYHSIWFNVPEVQSRAGVNPWETITTDFFEKLREEYSLIELSAQR